VAVGAVGEAVVITRRAIRFLDQRVGASPGIKKALSYVFPDHWSFMLGEIALYSFLVLVATGVYLTLFYVPSTSMAIYRGPYAPLHGMLASEAYRSVVDISLSVPAGLLIRQTHHWAADVFLAAIVLHLLRIFFTGAYRKPRDVNYWIGVTMLVLAILEGFLGYSLIDDLLSGQGLAIAYSVAMSIPIVGANLTFLVFNGQFPGGPQFFPRMFIVHVLVIPVMLAGLITIHLATIMRQHHTQFPGPGRTERNVVGTPMWPAYALRSIGLLLATAGVLFLLGGLVQINPIWLWGPYHTYLSTNGAQPDWYLGWLIGAMRLMPAFEPHIGAATLIPNPFFGGALFPTLVFLFLYAWPVVERRVGGDYRRHELLERPRDNPTRTAVGAAVASWCFFVFVAGSFDRVYFRLEIPYEGQIWFGRIATILVPIVVFFATRHVCRELKRSERHPLRGWYGSTVTRTQAGGYAAEPDVDDPSAVPADARSREPSPGSTLP
jgi:ubiquinol-cytochrome c reductase cytochrome b subunit